MEVTIIEQDIEKGTATIQFIHNNVTFVDKYDLIMVVPETKKTLEDQNLTFTADMQSQVITKLTEQVQKEIEAGIIENRK